MKLGFTRWYIIVVVHALSGCGGMGAAMVGPIAGSVLLAGGISSYSNPVEYHGYYHVQAEKETKSGKFDLKLWDEALVLVEGDKTKSYWMYIDLRANQLDHETEGSESKSSLIESLVFSTKISRTNIPGGITRSKSKKATSSALWISGRSRWTTATSG